MLMSGRIQRVLIEIFDRERDNAFTTEDLCERIWPDLYPGLLQQQEVTAAPSFERRATSLRSDRKSNGSIARDSAGSLVFFRHDEVMSYAMARLKADRFQRVSQPTIALEQRRGSLAPRTRRRKLP